MRAVIQRVSQARVLVDKKIVGEIKQGLLVLLAVATTDSESLLPKLADKLANLRIFGDQAGKMNLSVKDIKGEVLVVSQFTLYGDCSRGNRPSFIHSARPEQAVKLYEGLVVELEARGLRVATGSFGKLMELELINDGPTTIIIDL